MRIYTRTGDDGSTGLFYGGRVAKDDTGPEAYGTVDEAVAALGIARAVADEPLAERILQVQRSLFVLAAELATAPGKRERLQPGVSLVTQAMVDDLEAAIDEVEAASGLPTEFVVPGGSSAAAAIDLARTIVRRAERRTISHVRAVDVVDSVAVTFLNRLADYLFVLARSAEGQWIPSREER